jgi:hypothetical protein
LKYHPGIPAGVNPIRSNDMLMPTDEQARELEFTVEELAGLLYPGIAYDTALPQQWVDLVRTYDFDPRGTVVWLYRDGDIFGRPQPLTSDAYRCMIFIASAERKKLEGGGS